MANSSVIPKGRPLKFKTSEEMQVSIDRYFADCKKRGAPLTMTGLAIALEFEDRRSLIDYEGRDAFSHTIKKARKEVEQSVEELMLKSSGVVAGVIFNAKNNFGWRDKQEIDQHTELSGNLNIEVVSFASSGANPDTPAVQLHA